MSIIPTKIWYSNITVNNKIYYIQRTNYGEYMIQWNSTLVYQDEQGYENEAADLTQKKM